MAMAFAGPRVAVEASALGARLGAHALPFDTDVIDSVITIVIFVTLFLLFLSAFSTAKYTCSSESKVQSSAGGWTEG